MFREIKTAERVNENKEEQRKRKLKYVRPKKFEANDFWRQEFERIRKEANNED